MAWSTGTGQVVLTVAHVFTILTRSMQGIVLLRAAVFLARVVNALERAMRVLLSIFPGRVLWVRAMHPDARARWTGPMRLLTGSPVCALTGRASTRAIQANEEVCAESFAIAAWYRGQVWRGVMSVDVLDGRSQAQVAAAVEAAAKAASKQDTATVTSPALLGVLHNHYDVTKELRPWFSALTHDDPGVSASGVACLVGGRAPSARCHVVDALWDDFSETRAEGAVRVQCQRSSAPSAPSAPAAPAAPAPAPAHAPAHAPAPAPAPALQDWRTSKRD